MKPLEARNKKGSFIFLGMDVLNHFSKLQKTLVFLELRFSVSSRRCMVLCELKECIEMQMLQIIKLCKRTLC